MQQLTNAEYHAHPAISKSHLDAAHRSLRHYYARFVDPKRLPVTPTPAMALGSLVHALVLEPDAVERDFACVPPHINRRTKQGKEEYEQFNRDSVGKTIVTHDQVEDGFRIADAVAQNRAAATLLGLDGHPEQSYFWVDDATGLECKCRPDYITDNKRFVVDLKTTDDASPKGFAKSCANYRYHCQAAWYLDGVEQSTGTRPDEFIFIAVEKNPPYCVGVYRLSDADLEIGAAEAAADLAAIATGRETQAWPAYGDTIQTITLPTWYQ